MPNHARRLPVITLHRDTLLNSGISPAGRLLYVVLLAAAETPISMGDLGILAGIDRSEGLQQHLDELAAAGLVTRHGRTVIPHPMPLVPPQTPDGCAPCSDCGRCSCFDSPSGLCLACQGLRSERAKGVQDTARWKRELEAGATYTLGQAGNRLHRWDCHTLNSPDKALARLGEFQPEDADHGGEARWDRLPDLLTAHQVRSLSAQKPSCQLCKPELV